MKQHRIIRTKGQRIAWTNTSRIPDDEIVAAIKFVAAEADLNATVIHFKRSTDRSSRWGRAYGGIPSIANMDGLVRGEWRYLIVATDHHESTATASVLCTLAHEAKHVEQFRRGTFRRERRARNCEAQARAFGDWVASSWKER